MPRIMWWVGWQWEELARRGPLEQILTGGDRPWRLDDFLETGARDVDAFLSRLADHAPAVRRERVLDFGCGVGRISRALAPHFSQVVGVDVSPTMISTARRLNADCSRCQFLLNRRRDLRVFPSGSFDVVYSRLVLQHIRPVLVRRYLRELCRVTRRGGVLMFQLPTPVTTDPVEAFVAAPVARGMKSLLPVSLVRGYRYVKYWALVPREVETHVFGLPRHEVEEIVTREGCRLVGAFEDDSHGTPEPGFEYWATKVTG